MIYKKIKMRNFITSLCHTNSIKDTYFDSVIVLFLSFYLSEMFYYKVQLYCISIPGKIS